MALEIVKIPELTEVTTLNTSDQLVVETSAGTRRISVANSTAYSATQFLKKNVNDATTGVVTAAGFVTTSTEDVKANIRPLHASIEDVVKLVPVLWNWKYDHGRIGDLDNVGLIAEEVDKVFPDLVHKDGSGKILGIDYSKLGVYLILAIKDLNQRVASLEAKVYIPQ